METVINTLINPFDYLGRKIIAVLLYTLNVCTTLLLSFRAVFYDKNQNFKEIFRVVSRQVYFTGFEALPLISIIAFASGGIVIMQASFQLNILGGVDIIGKILNVVIVREVGPLLTALVVVARSGTAIASEIGNMKVNKEISALKSMGINPLSYIVFPRIIGGVISLLCLSIYFSVIALAGGFLFSKIMLNLHFSFFTEIVAQSFLVDDIYIFFIKNIFNGFAIFTVCSLEGLRVGKSPHEVPQSTTRAVMRSIFFVISLSLFVTTVFYMNQLSRAGGG